MSEIHFSKKKSMPARLFKGTTGLLAAVCLLMSASRGNCEDASFKEYQIKALFLFNFGKYVDWPAAAFPSTNTPITIGVLGTDSFGDNLQHDIDGKTINGRPLVIKHLSSDSDLSGCQILFISDSEAARMGGILEKASALPILTVGEDEQFAQKNGIINFVIKDGKVRLEIDLTTAKKAGVKISSKLLAVADVVKGNAN